MSYVILIVGFVLLVKGADIFVDGSSSVARIMKIPTVIIGLTIVAFGTSAPEAAVSIVAGLQGDNEIAISNVVGSNIFNTMVVIGVCAAILPFTIDRKIIRRDVPVNLGITILLVVMIFNGMLSRLEGIILLAIMAIYILCLIRDSYNTKVENDEDAKILSGTRSAIYIILGIAGIIGGAQLVVNGATGIATSLGMSQTLIGLTIIAIGTSLPELVTSIVAARKGESSLAIGNAVGSNIFNILFVLGLSSSLSPIAVLSSSVVDVLMATAATVLIFIFCITRGKMSRVEGIVSVLIYIGYMAYIIIR